MINLYCNLFFNIFSLSLAQTARFMGISKIFLEECHQLNSKLFSYNHPCSTTAHANQVSRSWWVVRRRRNCPLLVFLWHFTITHEMVQHDICPVIDIKLQIILFCFGLTFSVLLWYLGYSHASYDMIFIELYNKEVDSVFEGWMDQIKYFF